MVTLDQDLYLGVSDSGKFRRAQDSTIVRSEDIAVMLDGFLECREVCC